MSNLPTIVIPYFKLRYLDAALDSLAAQTRRGFKVFIGDDASPEDPREVIGKYQGRLDIQYRRFDENFGGVSLARHWNRCVRETDSEWVWLFSDDDLIGSECMESFADALAKTARQFDVFRFNTKMIDGNDAVTRLNPPHPECETAAEFALAKILSDRLSFAVEYIFRRSAFEAADGFVDFPLAWFSDDASWIAFARRTGFRTMERGLVLWRQSGLNISAPKRENAALKLVAFRRYLVWLAREFPETAFQEKLKAGITRRFPNQVQHWGGEPPLADALKFWLFFARFTGQLNLLLLRTLLGLTGIRSRLGFPKASPALSHE